MRTRRWFGVLGLAALALLLESRSATAGLLYSNVTNFTGFGLPNGGAANVGGDTITTMVADDITPGAFPRGAVIDTFVFSVANFNDTAVSARPLVRFYAADGPGGGPGTYITGFDFAPISFDALSVNLFTDSNGGSPLFTTPGGTFWAGITFDDNNGTTGATLDQLNNLGVGIFDPPTVGSSQDVFFQTAAAGSFAGSDPAGDFFFFGGSPVANFGWQFSGTAAAVPEPSSLALLALGGAALAGWRRWRRRGLRT